MKRQSLSVTIARFIDMKKPLRSYFNFLLDETDHYLTETLGLDIDRYVDDTATVDCDKEKLLLAMPLIREHLWQTSSSHLRGSPCMMHPSAGELSRVTCVR